MALPLCDECKAIYRELLELIEISRQSKPGPNATPQQLAAWFGQRDDDEGHSLRARPAIRATVRGEVALTDIETRAQLDVFGPYKSTPSRSWFRFYFPEDLAQHAEPGFHITGRYTRAPDQPS